jgi:hypothetical protein
VCVELKPKWGVLPDSPWVTHAVKRTHNRFVMQQHHKAAAAAATGASWRHSAFDPMDLFSYHRPSVQVRVMPPSLSFLSLLPSYPMSQQRD